MKLINLSSKISTSRISHLQKNLPANGVGLGEMDDMLLRKVEELTLYTIRQETELVAKGNEIKLLKAESELLKAQIAELAELKLLVKELLDK
jgi:hypothetical protein